MSSTPDHRTKTYPLGIGAADPQEPRPVRDYPVEPRRIAAVVGRHLPPPGLRRLRGARKAAEAEAGA